MNILGTNIQTVGQLRAALKNIPDTALLDVSMGEKRITLTAVGYNGIFADFKLEPYRIPGKGGYVSPRPFCLVADGVREDTPCIIRAGTAYRKDAPTKYLRAQENAISSAWTPDPAEAMVFPNPDVAAMHICLYLRYQKNATICPAPLNTANQVFLVETEDNHAD